VGTPEPVQPVMTVEPRSLGLGMTFPVGGLILMLALFGTLACLPPRQVSWMHGPKGLCHRGGKVSACGLPLLSG
jgi:hypothetical protein